jgi:hypothetical protein
MPTYIGCSEQSCLRGGNTKGPGEREAMTYYRLEGLSFGAQQIRRSSRRLGRRAGASSRASAKPVLNRSIGSLAAESPAEISQLQMDSPAKRAGSPRQQKSDLRCCAAGISQSVSHAHAVCGRGIEYSCCILYPVSVSASLGRSCLSRPAASWPAAPQLLFGTSRRRRGGPVSGAAAHAEEREN